MIYPRKIHMDLPTSVHIGIFTGERDEFDRKIILWSTGRSSYIEDWEENYYEVYSEDR